MCSITKELIAVHVANNSLSGVKINKWATGGLRQINTNVISRLWDLESYNLDKIILCKTHHKKGYISACSLIYNYRIHRNSQDAYLNKPEIIKDSDTVHIMYCRKSWSRFSALTPAPDIRIVGLITSIQMIKKIDK